MIINYLTWLKDDIGKEEDNIELPENIDTVEKLLSFLENIGDSYKRTLSNRNVVYAEINGEIVMHTSSIQNVKKISFFSPIVGG